MGLADIGIGADVNQIIMTNGVTHGLDLVARLLIRPGDAVLVDDPGYYTLFGYLKTLGAQLLCVTRNIDGPDVVRMEQLIKEFQPKLFLLTPCCTTPLARVPALRSHIKYYSWQKSTAYTL